MRGIPYGSAGDLNHTLQALAPTGSRILSAEQEGTELSTSYMELRRVRRQSHYQRREEVARSSLQAVLRACY